VPWSQVWGRWVDGRKEEGTKKGKRAPIGDRVTFNAMMDTDVIADIEQWPSTSTGLLKRRKPKKTEI